MQLAWRLLGRQASSEQQATFRRCGTFFRATCRNSLPMRCSESAPIARVQCQLGSVLTHSGRSSPWSVVLVSLEGAFLGLVIVLGGGDLSRDDLEKSDEVRFVTPTSERQAGDSGCPRRSEIESCEQGRFVTPRSDASVTRYWLSCSLGFGATLRRWLGGRSPCWVPRLSAHLAGFTRTA